MSLIEINPDVKLLVKELKRIASALEHYLILEYGFRSNEPSKDELAGEPPDVQYSSDEETAKQEIEELLGRHKEHDTKEDVQY